MISFLTSSWIRLYNLASSESVVSSSCWRRECRSFDLKFMKIENSNLIRLWKRRKTLFRFLYSCYRSCFRLFFRFSFDAFRQQQMSNWISFLFFFELFSCACDDEKSQWKREIVLRDSLRSLVEVRTLRRKWVRFFRLRVENHDMFACYRWFQQSLFA